MEIRSKLKLKGNQNLSTWRGSWGSEQ